MNRLQVSVVVAVRDGEKYLAQAMESILAQDYRPLEIIVVDGRSTDRTAEIARSFPLVRYILQEGRGVADAYNIGIAAAAGELVAFLSSDDMWAPDKLALQAGYLMEHADVQYITCWARFFLEPGCAMPPGCRPELLHGEHTANIMEALLARRALFEAIGVFDTGLDTAEDVDWFARAADSRIRSEVLPRTLVHKRIHDRNNSLITMANNRNIMIALGRSIRRKRGLAAPSESSS